MALNLLKNEKTAKGGIRAKRLQAGWNNDYLLTILNLKCDCPTANNPLNCHLGL
jgi:hypothetical protein